MLLKTGICACFASMICLSKAMTLSSPISSDSASTSTIIATTEILSHNATDTNFDHLTEEFLSCLKIEVQPTDYTLMDNKTLYVPIYVNFSSKGIWNYGNYYINSNDHSVALICSPFTSSKEPQIVLPQDILQAYLTVIGISISLLCLVLHFIAFILVPEMKKNLPSKNLASLTVSLFFAYLIFLVGKLVYEHTPTCYYLGNLIYYFMMVSFFWMNAISYDIFKSIRVATTKLRLTSKSEEWKWYILYSLYSWIVPALFSGIIVAGDKLAFLPEDLRPKFDEERCWFGQRLSIILFFATPVAILMLANFVFFVASAFTIFSNSMKSDHHTNNLKKNLTLYLKLAIIMGLVWITGLVSGTTENAVMSYIFVSLTTLQGLFIFAAFTRFKKTGALLKERVNTMVSVVHSSSRYSSSPNTNIHKQNNKPV